MIKSGELVHFTTSENPVTKISDGIMSLTKSYVKELAKAATSKDYKNHKDAYADAGLSLLGRKLFKKFHLWVKKLL